MQVLENSVTRGYLSSVESGLFFGLGKDTAVDKVEVIWPDGKVNIFENIKANSNVTVKYAKARVVPNQEQEKETLFTQVNPSDSGITYSHKENEFNDFEVEVLLPHKLSENGPFSAIGDVNGDGFEDMFIGGAAGQSGMLYLQNTKGKFIPSSSQPWEAEKSSEDLGVLFLDVDGDNDLDLYIASGGSEFKSGNTLLKDRLYINNGAGKFDMDFNAIPSIRESTECVKASDVDNDGDLDLFVGTRLISGQYPFPASSYILINTNGKFKKASNLMAPDLENIGMVSDAVFSDIDGDGDEDLLVVGEWMEILVLENNKGAFSNTSDTHELQNTRGLWWSITASDLDNDGDDDYIVGNLGVNNKFKASKEHPFKVYANDFDNNGTNDIVLAKFYKDDYVPVRGRECTSQQMPYVADKFKDFNSFASSKLLDILPNDKVKDAVIYEISNFESIILINESGKLIKQTLPIEAQVAPIKSSIVMDVNQDGNNDIVLVGNHYGVEVETTRYDAGFGAVLIGDGNNNFSFMPPSKSGFHVPLDSRDIKHFEQKNQSVIMVTNNSASPSIFFKNQ